MKLPNLRTILPAAVGAALMYLVDPDRGNLRRALLREQTIHLARTAWRRASHAAIDVTNRTTGQFSEYRARMRMVWPSDDVLVAHVRSTLGHVVRHPHRVTVTADSGWIELRGDVLPDEKEAIIGAVKHIPGVFGVQDRLSEHGWINGQPVA